MGNYPAPELNDGYFQVGTDLYPIPTGTGNTNLLLADKCLYYLLAFNEAILNYYVGAQFQQTCSQYGITSTDGTFTGQVVGSTYPLNIMPYLMDNGIAFPCLSMWRGPGTLTEKDISTHQWRSTLNLLYVVPPMRLSHIEQIKPLIIGAFRTLCQRNEYGHDVSYNDGYTISTLAGYSSLGVKTYDHLQVNIPGTSNNLPFEMFHIEMMLEEINLPITPSVYPPASFQSTVAYPYPDPLITLGINDED